MPDGMQAGAASAAAMILLVVVGVGVANDKPILVAFAQGLITVVVVVGGILGLCALFALWEYLREWIATPAILRAVTKPDALQALEKLSARHLMANAVNSAGFTALHVVCNSYRSVEQEPTEKIIDFLIAHGADVNAQTPIGGRECLMNCEALQ